MTIDNHSLVTFLTLLLAGLLLAQTLLSILFMIRIEQRIKAAEQAMERLSRVAGSSLAATREILEKLSWVPESLASIDSRVASLLEMVLNGLGRANEGLGGGIERVNRSIDNVSRRIEYGLTLFTRQTGRVRRGVRYPALNFSALMHGIKVGLQALRGETTSPYANLHDDENFI